jgi:hypothetical protein
MGKVVISPELEVKLITAAFKPLTQDATVGGFSLELLNDMLIRGCFFQISRNLSRLS